MQVLEFPTWHDWPIPPLGPKRFGHFVLFRIDTEASVAALEDDAASQAAALLPKDWFLGIIMANGLENAYFPDGRAMLNFRFSFLGVGLPDPAHASVPIAPAAQLSESRPPIALASTLPWSNLYVHTHSPPAGVISRVQYGSSPLAGSLDEEPLKRINSCVMDDDYDLSLLIVKQQVAAMKAQRQMGATSDVERRSSRSGSLPRSSSMTYDGSDSSSLDQVSLDDDMQDKFNRVRLYIELSFDSTACSGIPAAPASYEQRAAQVEDIWLDWRDRKAREILAKRPLQMAEWVQAVEGARDEPLEDERQELSDEEPLDEFAVLPEHAIDHIIEQGGISRTSFDSVADWYRPPDTSMPRVTSTTTDSYRHHTAFDPDYQQLALVAAGAANDQVASVPRLASPADPPLDASVGPAAVSPAETPHPLTDSFLPAREEPLLVDRCITAKDSPSPPRSAKIDRTVTTVLRSTFAQVMTRVVRVFGRKHVN